VGASAEKTTSNLTFAPLLINITFSRARLPSDVRISEE